MTYARTSKVPTHSPFEVGVPYPVIREREHTADLALGIGRRVFNILLKDKKYAWVLESYETP